MHIGCNVILESFLIGMSYKHFTVFTVCILLYILHWNRCFKTGIQNVILCVTESKLTEAVLAKQ